VLLQYAGCPKRGARRARHRVLSHEKVAGALGAEPRSFARARVWEDGPRSASWHRARPPCSATPRPQRPCLLRQQLPVGEGAEPNIPATVSTRRGSSLSAAALLPPTPPLAPPARQPRASAPLGSLGMDRIHRSRVGDGIRALRRQIDQYKPASFLGLFCRRSKTNSNFRCGLVSFRWKKRQVKWVILGKTNGA
jgi:hypothetical protein